MDTSRLELQAEYYVISTLSKFGFSVSKPQYDTEGCDLQILDNSTHPTRLLRVQVKGRSLKNSISVKIPQAYLNESFVLFLYTVDEEKNDALYIFFPEEIERFSLSDASYTFSCSSANLSAKYLFNVFDRQKAEILKERLLSAKIKKETTLLVDSFCIENGIKSTFRCYSEMYPEKKLSTPSVIDVVKQILNCYDKLKLENRIVNVFLFLTPHNFIKTEYYNSEELYIGSSKIRLFEMHIDGLVSFEIADFLNRIIGSENIILTASDVMYVPLIQQLKDEEKEVVLVCEKLDNGMRDAGFKWGDIVYPIAFAMGLQRNEI